MVAGIAAMGGVDLGYPGPLHEIGSPACIVRFAMIKMVGQEEGDTGTTLAATHTMARNKYHEEIMDSRGSQAIGSRPRGQREQRIEYSFPHLQASD